MRSVVVLTIVFVLIAILGPLLAPYDPTAINIPARLSPPSAEFPLGTDALGRDTLSRLLHGAQWSLGLAFVVSVIGLVVGTLIGLAAALGGKIADWVVMRTTDTFLAFPDLVAAVVIAGLMGAGTWSLIFALSVTSWMRYARAILGISALGFLGFGGQPPTPEWGAMLLDARVHLRSTPLQMIWPGLAVVICVLAISLAGDALPDAISGPADDHD